MHFVNHNFTDIDFETKHLNRIEKTIYFDLRSLYLSEEKPIDGSDMDLLERRLSVIDDAEKEALAFVLKDKFNKAGKYYKRAAWDKVLKNYKHANRNKGNAFGNDFGNTGNGHGNAGNDNGNALSNSERVAKSKQERKTIIANLTNTGVSFDKKAPIATLRTLHEKHVVIEGNKTGNESNAKNDAITSNHELLTNNHKPVREDAHTNTGEVIVDKFNHGSVDNSTDSNQPSDSQPVPVEPVAPQPSANQPATKADQIRDQRADDIENWEAPTIDEMRSELFRAGKMMQLTDDQYSLHVSDFKAHYAEQALLGKPIATESNRKAKLRKWLMGEVDKQAQSQARQEKAKGRFSTDNEEWGTTANKGNSNFDSDLPPIYHPSHSTSKTTDEYAPLALNGCKRPPLPGMTTAETEAHVDRYVQSNEPRVAAYDRLSREMKEAV